MTKAPTPTEMSKGQSDNTNNATKKFDYTAVAETHMKYKKRLLLRCIHHFKSDLINNMDHMRISGTEPSSVVLSQRSNFKS